MRVATLFKRLLGLGRERVVGIEIYGEGAHQEVIVDLARSERRRMRCSRCGRTVRGIYDRSTRSWRHLDLLRVRCVLRCEVRRIDCPCCGVVAEAVPWARSGSRHSSGFEDTCVWLARAAPKIAVAQAFSTGLAWQHPRARRRRPGHRAWRPPYAAATGSSLSQPQGSQSRKASTLTSSSPPRR